MRLYDVTAPKPLTVPEVGILNRTYQWMAVGVLLTFFVALYTSQSETLMGALLSSRFAFYGLVIFEIALVIAFNVMLTRMSWLACFLCYLFYCALNGVTFSLIFVVFTQASIANTFLVTAAGFAGLSLFGYLTKRDLGPVGTFCSMAVFGLIAVGLIAMFVPSLGMSDSFQIGYSIIGLVIFSGLTAYDTQKLKAMISSAADEEVRSRIALAGALTLYLDFINLFLNLLRLFGNRK